MRAIDVRTLTEAAESLGAKWPTILFRCIFPNVMSGVLSGAFITFAIVMGEFTMAALLNRPAFGPYQPSALAVIAFAITWLSMGLIQLVSRFQKSAPAKA
jgi:putative spermidine/putrescine transport system permease protein